MGWLYSDWGYSEMIKIHITFKNGQSEYLSLKNEADYEKVILLHLGKIIKKHGLNPNSIIIEKSYEIIKWEEINRLEFGQLTDLINRVKSGEE